jgi:hypothetical protein
MESDWLFRYFHEEFAGIGSVEQPMAVSNPRSRVIKSHFSFEPAMPTTRQHAILPIYRASDPTSPAPAVTPNFHLDFAAER